MKRPDLDVDRSTLRIALVAMLLLSLAACARQAAPAPDIDLDIRTQTLEDVTIDPSSNVLTLEDGETFTETITVMVPAGAGVTSADVYLLADTTGSMGSPLAAVRSGASSVVDGLITSLPGVDLRFGVGDYKDFPFDPYAFRHTQSITDDTIAIKDAINGWSAGGGADGAEGQFFALDQLAEDSDADGGTIGWRPDAKKIIVWFGDAPGHDPVCQAISSLGYDITEASLTDKLVTENFTVVAISTLTGFANGLDGNPVGNDYASACDVAGSSGQATRIATATGGEHRVGVDSTAIVDTITELTTTAVTTINKLSLVAEGDTAPFVTSIDPSAGYGPLDSTSTHVLEFDVTFTGECQETEHTYFGSLDVDADGAVVAQKTVELTVPSCNEPPTADAGGPYLVALDTTVAMDGTNSSDPDGDVLTYNWTADGGVYEDATLAEPLFTGEAVGVWPVQLTVTDPSAASDGDETYVVVYDPAGGFVTGGGWILSPESACALSGPCASATGKASFGFVSKYQKGRSEPQGQTQFQFSAGSLNFHSTSYEWLIIAGARAQYKGEGTINGSGDYGFILTAIDGAVDGGGGLDRFRIKIWDISDGDAIVYDNEMGASDGSDPATGLGGGSIVIHSGGNNRSR